MAKTITAANSVFTLVVPGLFDSPVQLEGYGADEAVSTDSIASAEAIIGVDGHKSAGFVFALVKQKITIEPTSPSLDFFYEWIRAMQSQREDLPCDGVIDLPAIGQTYNCVNGSLTLYPPLPGIKKVLQPLQFEITWERVEAAGV
jgi:hypothetical protein